MKTLVIHPKDITTDFLKPIYSNIKDAKVIVGGGDTSRITNYLKENDRLMFMGHGSPNGLFSIGKFNTGVYVVGEWCVDQLAVGKENVYIWCNADKFVTRYRLKGFYTGMFISEVAEARFCGLDGVTQDIVDESNETFATLLGSVITLPKLELYKSIKSSYGALAKSNPVAKYNWNRLYVS